MLKIKIVPTGRKGSRSFRAIVQECREKRDGSAIEILATFTGDPMTLINSNKERLAYWLKVGAQPTPGATKALGLK